MIKGIRDMEKALGSPYKGIGAEEKELYDFCRRKIYAAREINKGKIISPEDIIILRSGQAPKGLDPAEYGKIIGKRAKTDIKKDSPITWDVIL